MRLIRIGEDLSLSFVEIIGSDVPPYAILSHTWEQEEVSYDDFVSGRGKSMKGYAKIEGCAQEAMIRSFGYMWIDTCCIDKRSSAELSEAINSMYQWYNAAAICFAYLQDVPEVAFANSRWFTRGWTLQELLAPRQVIFFDQRWRLYGFKSKLYQQIASCTGIHANALRGWDLSEYSVARRMSWAAKRTTTRIEDMAYCLLGMFGISMPLLYGEGSQAFRRLQQEILLQTTDLSILAWTSRQPSMYANPLAASPMHFETCHDFYYLGLPTSSPSVTSKGLEIKVRLIKHEGQLDEFRAIIHYWADGTPDRSISLVAVTPWEDETTLLPQFVRLTKDPVKPLSPLDFSEAPQRSEAPFQSIVILNIKNGPIDVRHPDASMYLQFDDKQVVEVFGHAAIREKSGWGHVWYVVKPLAGKIAGIVQKQHEGRPAALTLILVGLTEIGSPWCTIMEETRVHGREGTAAAITKYRRIYDEIHWQQVSLRREHKHGDLLAMVGLYIRHQRPLLRLTTLRC